MKQHAAIIESVKLANNGYLYENALSVDEWHAANAAVTDGKLCKAIHYRKVNADLPRVHHDNHSVFYLKKDEAMIARLFPVSTLIG